MNIRNVLRTSMVFLGVIFILGSVKAQGGAQPTASDAAKIAKASIPLVSETSFQVNLLVNGLVDQDGPALLRFITDRGPEFSGADDFREVVWSQLEGLKASSNIIGFQLDRSSSQVELAVNGLSTATLRTMVHDALEKSGISVYGPMESPESGFRQSNNATNISPVNPNPVIEEDASGYHPVTSPSVPSGQAIIPGTVVYRIEIQGLDEEKAQIIKGLLHNTAFVWFDFYLDQDICVVTMNYPEVWTEEKTRAMIFDQISNRTTINK